MGGKFELKKTRNDQYHFNLKAGNGQVILTSETYTRKDGAENGIESVKTNAPNDARYERKQHGTSHTFVLKAANGEPIGTSESYTSAASRDGGIESVKTNAPTATVDDQA